MRFSPCLFVLLGLALVAHGRPPTFTWSDEKLIEESDTVVILEALGSRTVDDPFPLSGATAPQTDMRGLETRFKVLGVLKGETKADAELTLLHFTYGDKVRAVIEGPMAIHFPVGQQSFDMTSRPDPKRAPITSTVSFTPRWLAFLVKRSDNRYVPVTGPMDPQISFQLIGPSNMLAHRFIKPAPTP